MLVTGWTLLCAGGETPGIPESRAQTPVATTAAAASPAVTVVTNNPGSTPSLEAVQKLLARIEVLEQREHQRGESVEALQKQHQEQIDKLLSRIAELESKVTSLASARVLPETAGPAEAGPNPQELDQKIRILERKGELAAEAAEARAQESPKLSIGPSGFAFTSADTNFALRLRGIVQLDSRSFIGDNSLNRGNDTFLLRRARPIFEGTVFRDFDFQFVPDFGGSSVQIFDANLNYRFSPALQLRAGKFKGPVGLEQLQSDATLPFNERSLATALVPNRNVGVELWGDIGEGLLSYGAGVFNGTGDARNAGNVDFGDDKEFSARVFGYPLRHTDVKWLQGFGIGLGGSYSEISSNSAALPSTTGGSLPGYFSDAQQQFFAYNPVAGSVSAEGTHWRLSPQAQYLYGPFGLLGEYVISDQGVRNNASLVEDNLQHRAWQVSAQWVLTGEQASFNGIVPKRPFSLHAGGWGAWQFVGRFSQLDLDGDAFPNFSNPATSAHAATSWSVGINWWLNRNVRALTSFSHSSFDGGGEVNPRIPGSLNSPATTAHQDENVVFTRLQLTF